MGPKYNQRQKEFSEKTHRGEGRGRDCEGGAEMGAMHSHVRTASSQQKPEKARTRFSPRAQNMGLRQHIHSEHWP